MQWMNLKPKGNKVRFRGMMESGQLVDEEAEIVQTQVIAATARASIRNRDTAPLYHHTQEGLPPVWRENILIETGLEQPPGMDSRNVLEDTLALYKGIRTGAIELDIRSMLGTKQLAIVANVVVCLIFFACAWLASFNLQDGATTLVAEPTAIPEATLETGFN